MLFEDASSFWKFHETYGMKMNWYFSEDFRKLFEGMTKQDENLRWTIEEVKTSAWYNKCVYGDTQLKIVMENKTKSS